MGKVIKLDNLIPKLKKLDKEKTVGLITGCFDILHKGHKDLLSFAKSKCDILIVGLDCDAAIKKTKGSDRPINNQTTRANNLVQTEFPDYVLLLESEEKFDTSKADYFYNRICMLISPNYLFTTRERDSYLQAKKKRADTCNAKLVTFKLATDASTSKLIKQGLVGKSSEHCS